MYRSAEQKLDLILDVLRANQLHQSSCKFLQRELAQRETTLYFVPVECDCWLVESEWRDIPEEELRIDIYRPVLSINPLSDAETLVKITHLPTGLVSTGRARKAMSAKVEAMEGLSVMLDRVGYFS